MEDERRLKNRVKELRQRLGLRQADLAEQIGVTRQTILAIEKGRLNPSIHISLKLARILREPVDYVFYLAPSDDTPAQPPQSEAAPPKQSRRKEKAEPTAIIDLPADDDAQPSGANKTRKKSPPDDEEGSASQSIWDFV